jgi:DNA-binding SARP family transcriptional activator
MEFRLLGPLEVTCAGRALRLGAARERSVLAILLLNADGVVAVDSLVDQLWPEAPPDSAVHAVHVSISRLRRVLDDGGGRRIETRKPGYVVRVEPGELDLQVFERLCRGGPEPRRSRRPRVGVRTLRRGVRAVAGAGARRSRR